MSQANFNLRSWSSNSHHLQAIGARDKTSDTNPTVGLLGLRWNTVTSTLSLTPKHLPPMNTTFIKKRDVLQISSQIYDPLGWTTPVTVRTKILLQQICHTKLTWDEPLPTALAATWITRNVLTLSKETTSVLTAWHITMFHSVNQDFDVRNAKRNIIPPCATVIYHLERH